MLYRHFPKIANKEISICTVTLPLENLNIDDLESFGVTLAYLPTASAEAVNEAFPLPVVISVSAEAVEAKAAVGKASGDEWYEALAAALDARKARKGDFALIDFSTLAESGLTETAAHRAGALARAAEEAAERGRIVGFGFRARGGQVRPLAEVSERWSFWSADYSILSETALAPVIGEMGNRGIPLLATDPFVGGVLSGVPAAVHELYYSAPVPRAHEEWALRGIWENQNVLSVALPPSSQGDFIKRCIYAGAGRANSLPESELKVLRAAAAKLLT